MKTFLMTDALSRFYVSSVSVGNACLLNSLNLLLKARSEILLKRYANTVSCYQPHSINLHLPVCMELIY